MDAEFLCLSDSESTTETSSNSNTIVNGPSPPRFARFRCSHCPKTFSTGRELFHHHTKYQLFSRSRKTPMSQFLKALGKNPQTPTPPLPPSPPPATHSLHAIETHGVVGNHLHYRQFIRPQEYQFFPASPDESSARTMDLLSLIDRPGSVPNQQFPEPSGIGASEEVAGWGASIGLDVMDLELKL